MTRPNPYPQRAVASFAVVGLMAVAILWVGNTVVQSPRDSKDDPEYTVTETEPTQVPTPQETNGFPEREPSGPSSTGPTSILTPSKSTPRPGRNTITPAPSGPSAPQSTQAPSPPPSSSPPVPAPEPDPVEPEPNPEPDPLLDIRLCLPGVSLLNPLLCP